MGGKHRSEAGQNGGSGPAKFVVWGVALLLIVGGLVVARSLTGADADSGGQAATAGGTGGTSTTASTATTGATTPTSTPTTSTPAAQSGTVAADPVAALLPGCRTQVAAQERLRAAGAASYRDWNLHVQAQLAFADGSKTLSQAEAQWADSKSRAAADLAEYAKAAAAAKSAGTACDQLARTTLGSAPGAAAAKACVARSRALVPVAAAGKAVNDDWARHVQMMSKKQDMPSSIYSRMWLGMVEDAQPVLSRYRSAAAAAAKVGGCPA